MQDLKALKLIELCDLYAKTSALEKIFGEAGNHWERHGKDMELAQIENELRERQSAFDSQAQELAALHHKREADAVSAEARVRQAEKDLRATVAAEYAKVKHIGGMGDGPVPDPEEMVRRMRAVMLATENLLEKLARELEETKEQVSGLAQSRDAYARIAQELTDRLGDVKKTNAKEVARLRDLVVYTSGPGWVPVKDGEKILATDEWLDPSQHVWRVVGPVSEKFTMDPRMCIHRRRRIDKKFSCSVSLGWFQKPETKLRACFGCGLIQYYIEPEEKANKPCSCCGQEMKRVRVCIDQSQPCSTCFFNQNAMCVHEKTSSRDPAECRTRPADACGPAGKLWAAKKTAEAPKCEECSWSYKMSYGLVCERGETRGFCQDERKYSPGACGPTGKLFEPAHQPVAMPAPPDAPRNEYAGEADEREPIGDLCVVSRHGKSVVCLYREMWSVSP